MRGRISGPMGTKNMHPWGSTRAIPYGFRYHFDHHRGPKCPFAHIVTFRNHETAHTSSTTRQQKATSHYQSYCTVCAFSARSSTYPLYRGQSPCDGLSPNIGTPTPASNQTIRAVSYRTLHTLIKRSSSAQAPNCTKWRARFRLSSLSIPRGGNRRHASPFSPSCPTHGTHNDFLQISMEEGDPGRESIPRRRASSSLVQPTIP